MREFQYDKVLFDLFVISFFCGSKLGFLDYGYYIINELRSTNKKEN